MLSDKRGTSSGIGGTKVTLSFPNPLGPI